MGGGGDPSNCFLCSSSSVTSSECLEGSSWTSVKLLVVHLLQLTPELRWEPPPSFDERRRVYHRIFEGGNRETTSEEGDLRRRIRICGACQGIAERVNELHNEIRKVVQGLREVVVNARWHRRSEEVEDDFKETGGDEEYLYVLRDFYELVSALHTEKLGETVVKVEEEGGSESCIDHFNDNFTQITDDDEANDNEVTKRPNTTNRKTKSSRAPKKLTLKNLRRPESGGKVISSRNYSMRQREVHGVNEEAKTVQDECKSGVEANEAVEEAEEVGNDDNDEDWSPFGADGDKCRTKKSSIYKRFSCQICPDIPKFAYRFQLTHHLIQVHSRSDLGVKCEVPGCSKVFLSKDELRRHTNVHLRRFVCPECDVGFDSDWKLQRHSVTHSKPKPEPAKPKRPLFCDQCHITFPDRQRARRHRNKCHPTKPPERHQCHLCPRDYASKTILTSHLKMVHGEGDLTGFSCEICGRHFLEKSQLANHIATHQKDKNFTCETCGFATNTKENLRRHQRFKHKLEKKLGCPHCEKKFKVKVQLEDHIRVHTKERPFQCDSCGKSYSTTRILSAHKKNLHGR